MADTYLEADRLEAPQTAEAVALAAEHARRTMGDPGVYATTLLRERDEARALLREARAYIQQRIGAYTQERLEHPARQHDGYDPAAPHPTLLARIDATLGTYAPRAGWREVRPGDWRYVDPGFALSVGRAGDVCLYFWGESRGGNVVADGHAPTLAAAMLAAERSAGVTP